MRKLHFPMDERDNFLTNSEKVHCVLLRMLKIVSQICSRHRIPFWLDYGSMLGAVRHHGFIPWDMEADIGILRPDFEKLQKVIGKGLPQDIFFQTAETDPYYTQHKIVEAKFRDKYSNYTGFQKAFPEAKWHNGIQIDIFVYDACHLGDDVFLLNQFEKALTKCKSFFKFSEIESLVNWDFEDTKFYIPVGYARYLKRNYGDYMKLPPKSGRKIEEVSVTEPCNHIETLEWKVAEEHKN